MVFGGADCVAAEQQRRDLPHKIMNRAQTSAIRPPPECRTDIFHFLIGSVLAAIAQGQEVLFHKKEMREIIGRIVIDVIGPDCIAAKQFHQRGNLPVDGLCAVSDRNRMLLADPNVALPIRHKGDGQFSRIQPMGCDQSLKRWDRIEQQSGALLG